MKVWTKQQGCLSKVHCVACRTDSVWREGLVKAGLSDEVDFTCPYGVNETNAEETQNQSISNLPRLTYKPTLFAKATWKELHQRALNHTDNKDDSVWLLSDFTTRVVNIGCKCREGWKKVLLDNPPDFTNYFVWSVTAHNIINKKLGKPIISLEKALDIWNIT